MIFYDRNGMPVAYSEDGEHIYLFNGQPVAYFYENTVYGYNGHQFGWFENGWIRDLQGKCAFYSEYATGSGPVKPVRKVTPVKSVKRVKPVKSVKQVRRVRPVSSLSWSQLSGTQFFNQ
jgi:hypothetical protein